MHETEPYIAIVNTQWSPGDLCELDGIYRCECHRIATQMRKDEPFPTCGGFAVDTSQTIWQWHDELEAGVDMKYRIWVDETLIEEFEASDTNEAEARFVNASRANRGRPAKLEQLQDNDWIEVMGVDGTDTKGVGV